MADELRIRLPLGRMLACSLLTPSLIGGVWAVVSLLGPWGQSAALAGAVGAAVVALTALLGVLVMGPWAKREISMWMTLWLAGTVLRLLLTPAITFLLYSATSLNGEALALSVAGTYLATLFSEAIVLSMYLRRAL